MRTVPSIIALCMFCVLSTAVALPNMARASSLEDFEDSQRRRSTRRTPRTNRAPSLTTPPAQPAPQVVPASTSRTRTPTSYGSNVGLALAMLVGDNPGALFSFGLSPWRDRVRLDPPATNDDGFVSPNGQGLIGYASSTNTYWQNAPRSAQAGSALDPKLQAQEAAPEPRIVKPVTGVYLGQLDSQGERDSSLSDASGAGESPETVASATPDTETDGYLQGTGRPDSVEDDGLQPERMRTFHLVARGAVSLNLDPKAPARGFDSFLTLESSYTPAFTFAWQTLRDQPNADTLHLAQMAYEPRWVTSQNVMMRPVMGASFIATEEGLLRAGALFGLGFEWFPVRPLYTEFRISGQLYVQSLGNMDVFTAIGVEVLPTIFIYSSYRVIFNELSALSIGSAGLRFDIGI